MLDLIHYITSFFYTANSLFCKPPLCNPNCNIHLLPGTPLYQQIHPNLKEFKAIADFLWAYIEVIVKVYQLD
jgi:hypothetical protein